MGSSPLARGLRLGGAGHERAGGIIPARAGFTRRRPGRSWGRPDHPRSRGVYGDLRRRAPGRAGSSPLARGLRLNPIPERLRARIIPARAGFTAGRGPQDRDRWDHPRSRGVYLCGWVSASDDGGSSPLARGLPIIIIIYYGIIPARAGFTRRVGVVLDTEEDHPRSRGVYVRVSPCIRRWRGSSPLARGLHPPAPRQ